MIRVYLLDDHQIVREAMRCLIETADDLVVIGDSGTPRDAVEEVITLAPDVLVTDISMPEIDGLEVVRRLRAARCATRALVVSMLHDVDWVRSALDAGAFGYLAKGSGIAELLAAIRNVAQGRAHLSPGAARIAHRSHLTPRETEVLVGVAEGLKSATIASQMGIATKTVEHHRARIADKLGVNDVPGLTRYALRRGWVDWRTPVALTEV